MKDFVAVMIINQVDDLMTQVITEDDAVDNMRVYVSNERMRRTDATIWEEFIATGHTDKDVAGTKAMAAAR